MTEGGDPFDRYERSSDYEAAVAESIAFAHVGHEMFIHAKAMALLDVTERRVGAVGALEFLDVGCGVGAMQRYVAPLVSRSVGIDTSAESISAARDECTDSELLVYDGLRIPFDDDAFDVTFAVNVVHHVEPQDRGAFAAELVRVTRPTGIVVVFEQNPLNPLTRLAVARCAFDDGVVLWGRGRVQAMLDGAGSKVIERRYVLFFPIDRAWARAAERHLGWLPAGAQHMVVARPAQSKA